MHRVTGHSVAITFSPPTCPVHDAQRGKMGVPLVVLAAIRGTHQRRTTGTRHGSGHAGSTRPWGWSLFRPRHPRRRWQATTPRLAVSVPRRTCRAPPVRNLRHVMSCLPPAAVLAGPQVHVLGPFGTSRHLGLELLRLRQRLRENPDHLRVGSARTVGIQLRAHRAQCLAVAVLGVVGHRCHPGDRLLVLRGACTYKRRSASAIAGVDAVHDSISSRSETQ